MSQVESSGELRPDPSRHRPANGSLPGRSTPEPGDPPLDAQWSLHDLSEVALPDFAGRAPVDRATINRADPARTELVRAEAPIPAPAEDRTQELLDDRGAGRPQAGPVPAANDKVFRDCKPCQDTTPWRPELFEKCCEPWILHGRQDVASFLYYGGLSATGYAWRDFSAKIFERSAFHTEVHALAGHDGVWEHFRDTNHRAWVDDIVAKARTMKNPIFFGHSTSALAAIVAAAENPGLFKGLVLCAPPLQLRSGKHSLALTTAEFLCSRFPNAFKWLENKCVAMRGDSNPALSTKHTRRSPHFNAFPGPVIFSLKRLQREAWKALPKIDIPILVMQGEQDGIVSPKVPAAIMKRVKSEQKQHRSFPDSSHSVMLGLEKKEALGEICSWLKNVCLPTLADPSKVPDMKTRLTKDAAVQLVMGTVWARFRELGMLNEKAAPDKPAAETAPPKRPGPQGQAVENGINET